MFLTIAFFFSYCLHTINQNVQILKDISLSHVCFKTSNNLKLILLCICYIGKSSMFWDAELYLFDHQSLNLLFMPTRCLWLFYLTFFFTYMCVYIQGSDCVCVTARTYTWTNVPWLEVRFRNQVGCYSTGASGVVHLSLSFFFSLR